ncbi:phospholipase D-like domain-containing protein [Frankia sp. AiPs1]|uniref:phospholipase D-like domain-containing protein n=1 Tax=Frankia sp. AiPs1 TaxID=573493 RepID=UPI002042BF0C|nr:phospholipase D-like domain-containing protein [Frankia sp. AiPs1]MCM3921979.1 phospholipase D-like domain-containing protein [Frankia sp. AiPs1]
MPTTLVLVAVPGGADPRRVDVVVLPRLSGARTLAEVPGLLTWTQRLVDAAPTIDLELAGRPWSAQTATGGLRPDLWQALFRPELAVEDFVLEDHRGSTVRSSPTGTLAGTVEDLVTTMGLRSPGRPPTTRELDELVGQRRRADDRAGLQSFERDRLTWADPGLGVLDRELREQRMREALAADPPSRQEALDRFRAMRLPGRADRSDRPWPGRPDPADTRDRLDVHGVLGTLTHHPALLRALGLVIELELPPDAPGLAAVNPGEAFPTISVRGWSLLPAEDEQLGLPRTAVDPQDFLPAPTRFAGRAMRGGVAHGAALLDPALWSLVQFDVEGALTKALNIAERDPVGGRADPGVEVGLPALRSDGFAVTSLLYAPEALLAFERAARLDAAVRGGVEEVLTAAHLTHGYRVDVWHDATAEWRSLHLRRLAYDIGGVPWPAEDEGFSTASLTAAKRPAGPPGTPRTFDTAEAVVRWTGWSLSAPRPYAPIGREVTAQDAGTEPEGAPPATSPLSVTSTPQPRSLPRLRFGDRYRMRLRAVDLGGGGLRPGDGGDLPALPPEPAGRRYLRFEPVAAPVVATLQPAAAEPGAGEPDRRPTLAIDSRNLTPDLDGVASTATATAVFLPPKATVDLVERHGCLDDASGRLFPAAEVHALLAARDVATDRVSPTGPAVPHLTDPLARGIALRGLPGVPDGWLGTVAGDGTLTFEQKDPLPFAGAQAGVVVLRFGGTWPDPVPLSLRLAEGVGLPVWDAASRTLDVMLPKGRRTEVRVSTLLDPADLSLLGVWEWFARRLDTDLSGAGALGDWAGAGERLTGSMAKRASITRLALEGGHWALTPASMLRLEHRVSQPLGVPRFTRFSAPFTGSAPDPGTAPLDVARAAQATTASLSGGLLVDLASTGAVTVRAAWSDPLDDPSRPEPTRVQHDEVIGKVEVPEKVSIGDVIATPGAQPALVVAENALAWPGTARIAGVGADQAVYLAHAIGDTRHHVVRYQAETVSRDAAGQPEGTATSRVGAPAEIHLPASANPDAPVVADVVPAFGWEREHTTDVRTSVRRGRAIRVYLERPWFSSGDGELLGVVCLPATEALGDRLCTARDAVSLWGLDPLHAGGALSPEAPRAWSFPEALAVGEAVRVPHLDRVVDVAAHAVHFDAPGDRWFSDVVLDAGEAYTPFVRLVLVRYQAHALTDREISPSVVVDHLQLSPDRAVTVATLPDDPHRRVVAVTGVAPARPHGPFFPAAPSFRTEIEVTVERSVPERGPDLGWERAPDQVATVAGGAAAEPSQAVLWRGEVLLEDATGTGLRLVVTEQERYRADPASPAQAVVMAELVPTGTRTVFAETIPLGPPLAAPEVLDGAEAGLSFTAPLFTGDAVLTSVLNAEATLGDRPGDVAPADSVRHYQSALAQLGFDLGPSGADGVWGPATYAASLAFKTALDIRTEAGVVDGYPGPRTLAALEGVFGYGRFDETAAAAGLGARTGEQGAQGDDVVIVPYTNGVVVCLRWASTCAIPEPLSDAWLAAGGPADTAGRPTGDAVTLPGGVVAQPFETTALVQTSGGEVVSVPLKALAELASGRAGAPAGEPGPLPAGGDVIALVGSLGAVLWTDDAPAVAIPQAVLDRWLSDAAAGDPPGAPIAGPFQHADGTAFPFTAGTLVLAPAGVDRLPPGDVGLDRFRLPPDPTHHLGAATEGSDVRLLVGGDAFFASLADDLAQVGPGGFVYLSSWNCQIDLAAFPGGRSLRQALTEVTGNGKGAEVAMQLWEGGSLLQAAGPLARDPMTALALDALQKAFVKPNVNNPIAVGAVRALPNSFAFVDGNHAKFGSHHQKIVVVHTGTELLAYIGGMEFTDDRLLPVSKGAPLFDVSVRIRGPGAQPVLNTFVERWTAHPDGAAHPLKRAAAPVPAVSRGPVRVQVGHTYSAGLPFPEAIRTASELAANAILSSRSYFFMEDQYFVGDPRLGAAIRSALTRGSTGIVVIAAEDSVEDLPDVAFRRRAFIDPIAAAFPGRFLVFEAVGDDGTSTGPHAYVHAKMVLVDDEALVIGSMNSSRRSWTHDSEVMAALVDQNGPAGTGPGSPGFAKTVRMDLWSRHLRPTGFIAVPVPIEPLPAALLAWTAAAAGVTGLSVRPYPPPGAPPPRPHERFGPVNAMVLDPLLDIAWNTILDPA